MLALAPDEALYFLHIPKTAGMTLVNLLDNQFHLDEIFPAHALTDVLTQPELLDNINQYRLYRGHFNQSLFSLVNKPLTVITVLRDPIERTISNIDYAIQLMREGKPVPWPIDTETTLETFVQNSQLRDFQTDIQYGCMTSDLRWFDEELYGMKIQAEKQIINARLRIAQNRLQHYCVVGIQERFYDTMLLLSYELGFLPPKQITNYNVSKRKTQTDQLAPATLEQLRAMNTLDDQLYRYALTLFDQKLEAMRRHLNSLFPALAGNPEEQLTLYHQQRRNDIEPRLKVANPPKPAEPIRYTFDQILAGSGWHPRERWEDQVVRWTGPGDAATLQFQLPTPCPYHVKVTVLDAVNQTARRQLRLLVNQVEVPLQFETDGDAWYYRGTVPQDALKDIPSGQEIRLQVPAAQLSEKSSHDSRLAGVCIASLEFFPVIPLQGRDEPLIIHFEDEMFGQNWYAVEYFRESGNRWTGPGKTATMHVGLHRGQNYQLKLDVLDFATEEARNSFHIRVNGVDVPLQAAETEVGFDYTGEILQTTLLPDSDAQWFEFIVDQTTPIRAADGSIERVLGVRLTSMTLTPVKAEVRNDSPLHILRGVLKTIQAKRASQ